MITVALTGPDSGKITGLVDYLHHLGTSDTPRVQEACMHLGHSICELIETTIFPWP